MYFDNSDPMRILKVKLILTYFTKTENVYFGYMLLRLFISSGFCFFLHVTIFYASECFYKKDFNYFG